MQSQKVIEIIVGFFIILGMLALIFLAFKVSGMTSYFEENTYKVTANFDNIGQLKERAPVTIAGVRVGEVDNIQINPQTFRAIVTLRIDSNQKIPTDSSASILTAGLLGANYISINPGYNPEDLKDGSVIQDTHPALVLENLIGQLLFKVSNSKK